MRLMADVYYDESPESVPRVAVRSLNEQLPHFGYRLTPGQQTGKSGSQYLTFPISAFIGTHVK